MEGERSESKDQRPVDRSLFELVRSCAKKLDDALAPLVAAGVVRGDLANSFCTEAQSDVLEANGLELWAAMALPRTAQAIEVIGRGGIVAVIARPTEEVTPELPRCNEERGLL